MGKKGRRAYGTHARHRFWAPPRELVGAGHCRQTRDVPTGGAAVGCAIREDGGGPKTRGTGTGSHDDIAEEGGDRLAKKRGCEADAQA